MIKTLASNARGAGPIPDQRVKNLHAPWPKKQNIKQKQYCSNFNKNFKNGPPQKNKVF